MRIFLIGTGAAAANVIKFAQTQPNIHVAGCATSSKDNLAELSQHTPMLFFDRSERQQILESIHKCEPDLLLSVTSPWLLSNEWLKIAKVGSFNLHPAPLPRYAGFHAHIWAILEGATRFGVTLHEMIEQVDAGPIVGQEPFDISNTDTGGQVFFKCVRAADILLKRFLNQVSRGEIVRQVQSPSERRYFTKSVPNMGRVDPTRDTALHIARMVRAFNHKPFASPIGSVQFKNAGLEGLTLDAVKAEEETSEPTERPLTTNGSTVTVPCANQTVLRLITLSGQPAAKFEDQLRRAYPAS